MSTCPELCSYRGGNANLPLPAGLNAVHDDSTHQTAPGTACKPTAPQNYRFAVPAVDIQCPVGVRPGLRWHSKVLSKSIRLMHTPWPASRFLDMWQPRWIYCLLTPNWSLNIWKLWTITENTQDFLGKALVRKSDYASESEQNIMAKLHFDVKILWYVLPASQADAYKPWTNDWLHIYKYFFNPLWKKALFECILSVKQNYLSSIFWLSPMTDLQENILLTKHVTVGHIWWQYISKWSKSAVREIRLVIISLQ